VVAVKKVLSLAIAAGLLVSTLFVSTSSAQVGRIETRLSFKLSPSGPVSSGEEVRIFGQLKPTRCRLGQTVRVYSAEGVPDTVIGTDDLNRRGEYAVTINPTSDLRVYGLVESALIVNGSGDTTHKCKGDRTRFYRIDVS
jgi:hypothetical protein